MLNYAGVGVALLSLLLYIFIEPAEKEDQEHQEAFLSPVGSPGAQVEAQIRREMNSISVSGVSSYEYRGDRGSSFDDRNKDYAGLAPGQGSRMVRNDSQDALDKLGSLVKRASSAQLEDEMLEQEFLKNILQEAKKEDYENSWIDRLPPESQRILGVTMAALAGVLYGFTFDPPQWIIDNRGPESTHGKADCAGAASGQVLDYVFSLYSGIWLTSTTILLMYCVYTGNRPSVNPQVILPGILSGILWAIANTSWFVANEALSFAVAFPLVTSGPGFVAALWGVLVFREIEGQRNFIVLGCAFCTTVSAGLMIGMSA